MIKKEMSGKENNPYFVQAMKYALQVLYEKGAAKDVAEQVRACLLYTSDAADDIL
jgi:hypothetical protein